jgi:hypothetical protein
MTEFLRSTSRGVAAASQFASETPKMFIRTADERSDAELRDGRTTRPYVPSKLPSFFKHRDSVKVRGGYHNSMT